MTTSKEAKEGYISTLADLTFNSKPLINVLTMLADENIVHAADIVEAIESHLAKVRVEIKLPVLYLIDCIIKNVGGTYTALFCHNIVTTFCSVFEVVDEKTRGEMFKLRQTWNDVLPKSKLYAMDVQVNHLDPAWPVITPQPTNSIHLNPKFLHTSAIPKKSPPLTTTPLIANPEALDPATLDMQKKLIIKQQQLLELQQKKIELELLQTQVKLQEQWKHTSTPTESTKIPVKMQNALLKPEVAKQLSGTSTSNAKHKPASAMSTMVNNRLSNATGGSGSVPTTRIAPVNSALIAAARPIRDPRLLRHQSGAAPLGTSTANSKSTINVNAQIQNKTNNSDPPLGSNNKVFASKISVRDNRSSDTPRPSVNAKGGVAPLSQHAGKPKVPPSRSFKKTVVSKDSDPVVVRSSKSSRSVNSSNSSSKLEAGSPSKGSTSSLDSMGKIPKGGKGNRSASNSPLKKKREVSAVPRPDRKNVEKISSKGIERSDGKSPTKGNDGSLGAAFKELKAGSKMRNYARRNRDRSVTPPAEPIVPTSIGQDVDLRTSGPPLEQQQLRIQGDAVDEKSVTNDHSGQGMDVDLRQLPGMVGKKRSSTEAIETVNPKRTKSEFLDVLFGNEDTDLRVLTGELSSPSTKERPKTPPPPIISSTSELDVEITDSKSAPKNESPKVNSLDVLRAKLANATYRDKQNKSKFNVAAEQKVVKRKNCEDTDLRSASSMDSKIIISSADEQCIKMGNMTKEQEKALMNKILAQIEFQKLNEAKRKDTEENVANISLQPISDEELDADFSGSNSDDEHPYKRNATVYADKDDRVTAPPAPVIKQDNIFPVKFGPRNIDRDQHWGAGPWRAGRGRRGSGMMPRGGAMRPIRPGLPEPWSSGHPIVPNIGPWRPMGFTKHHHQGGGSPFGPHCSADANLPSQESNTDDSVVETQQQQQQEIPELLVVDCAHRDNSKSINIDGIPRDIRYYDDTAVVFMNWYDPREISFQSGSRKVTFDDTDSYVFSFNEPYREITVNGLPHAVRLGAPTRELYVDGKWYECFFGGPGVSIEMDGRLVTVKMEGPPPQVKIGDVRRIDLVAGKITLIIDAKTVVPVFLDGKVQKFEVDGKTHDLKFVDALRTVLIDDVPFDVGFGQLPKPIVVHDKKHFIRFSVLPKDIKPGHVRIKDMEGGSAGPAPSVSPQNDTESSMDAYPFVDTNEPALPVFGKRKRSRGGDSPDRNSNSPLPLQNLLQQQNLNNLDMLSNVMVSSLTPTQNLNLSGYQVENMQPDESSIDEKEVTTAVQPATHKVAPLLPTLLNVNDLFQKLVATGIVTTAQETSAPAVRMPQARPPINKREYGSNFKPVNFGKPESLKTRQPSLIQTLYTGMQCSSCGMRFPPEHSMQYSQHLDWHFRQNRKGKKNIRKAASRKWYYTVSDWKNYEEIEDLEEREKSYFENQQQAQNEGASDEVEEEIEIPSVPADPNVQDARCEVCQDRFDQFYNEEKEEWQLRMAIRIDEKNYHPLCYEDYQASLVDASLEEHGLNGALIGDGESTAIPGLEIESIAQTGDEDADKDAPTEIVIDDDDDSVKPTDDDEKVAEEDEAKVSDAFPPDDEGDDDDVIINEVVPEKIDLVDDDNRYGEDDEGVTVDSSARLEGIIKEEPIDDGFMDVEDGVIKMSVGEVNIKSEPVDADFESTDVRMPEETDEDGRKSMNMSTPDTHHTEVVAYIDGNIEFDSGSTPAGTMSGKIKINITKPLPVIPPKENKEVCSEIEKSAESIDPSQPLPPGEEPPIQLNLKPVLQGIELKKLAPVKRGTELTGLCSIM